MNPDQFINELGILGKEFQGIVQDLKKVDTTLINSKTEFYLVLQKLDTVSFRLHTIEKSLCDSKDKLDSLLVKYKYLKAEGMIGHMMLTLVLLLALYLK